MNAGRIVERMQARLREASGAYAKASATVCGQATPQLEQELIICESFENE